MPLVRDRQHVLDLYARAADRGWVVAAFNAENLTTTEAVLAAAAEHGRAIGQADLPIALAITNCYPERPQAIHYTHTGDWRIGIKLFLGDVEALTGPDSPFAALNVIAHLDHAQPTADRDLLAGDLGVFSSIMYDASMLPMAENIARTREFVKSTGGNIVVEGACDEIRQAGDSRSAPLTRPDEAATFLDQTGVDFLVVNLGTEHRSAAGDRKYHAERARQITEAVGPRLVLHGSSSLPPDAMRDLFADGIRKVNIWTALERDSSPALLREMVAHAAKVAGRNEASRLSDEGLLGPGADTDSPASISHFTTRYRQQIIFEQMKRIAIRYLRDLYR